MEHVALCRVCSSDTIKKDYCLLTPISVKKQENVVLKHNGVLLSHEEE
jgi:hypothetical protein